MQVPAPPHAQQLPLSQCGQVARENEWVMRVGDGEWYVEWGMELGMGNGEWVVRNLRNGRTSIVQLSTANEKQTVFA